MIASVEWPTFPAGVAVTNIARSRSGPNTACLGRHVYLATVVTLLSALMLGTTPSRLARLVTVGPSCVAQWSTATRTSQLVIVNWFTKNG